MNHPLIAIGAFLIGWGLYTPKKESENKTLTDSPNSDTVEPDNAKDVPEPENEKANIDNSNSESGGVDRI